MNNIKDQIECINKFKHFADLVESPEEYFQHMQGHYKELSLILNVFDVAAISDKLIEALEKQIPKKPNKLTYKPLLDDGWRYECPTCKGAVGENIFHPEVTDSEMFCCSCGQALDV